MRCARRKARQEEKEAPGDGASRCRPRVNRHGRRSSQEDPGGAHRQVVRDTEYEDKDKRVKYVPRGRVAD